jgi:hypothetical protein
MAAVWAKSSATSPYPGMFSVVPALVAQFAGEVWLISKPGRASRKKHAHGLRIIASLNAPALPPTDCDFAYSAPTKPRIARSLASPISSMIGWMFCLL